ncbi:tRNA (guanosine(46)-N7)-methyltransferase TrmB [Isoptericola dokdonensis]|uniref:tRNA (guanine-N(7)-)-methyltransferase n=1 Tax=Isoptericola dokdonensis DS-3 TaxID=1300344 RepID=A0A168F169_9MICO|nr:tRNA (guanosine(46)-N7)-methyltransferase TrmB [Isoptericola dokdonensis]ANC30762.1 tRNA (guanine-N(7)-)-methyltransferase [Isoptericola dokdonensis DS-3]
MPETPKPTVGEAPHLRRPLSYVRRTARLTPSQQRAWDTRRHQYLVDVRREAEDRVLSVHPDWRFDAAAEFGRTAPVVMEIGTGLGECVVHAAASHPERDHVAVEVYTPGVASTIVRAGHAGTDPADAGGAPGQELTNLRILQADAAALLEHGLPAASLDELWVFFPDPWPKQRHHKRRLVSPEFADLAARVLRPGGVWRLATDWAEYGEVMLAVGDAAEQFHNAHGTGNVAPRFDGRVMTSFERKGLTAGRSVTDLEFVRR